MTPRNSEAPAPGPHPRQRRNRRILFGTLLRLALGTALFLLLLEGILAAFPGLLPPFLGNPVYGSYNPYPWGMYFSPPGYPLWFLRPHRDLDAYWNGYRWHHHSDGLGFRNPDSWSDRSILLLGDSMIYGHGVEVEDTVAWMLRDDYGRPAYNMARQGDCLFQEYVLMRLYAEELRPRTVVLFVFLNDFSDLFAYRTPEELADPPEFDRWDYGRLRESVAAGTQGDLPWRYRTYLRLRSLRLLDALRRHYLQADALGGAGPAVFRLDRSQRRLAEAYTRSALQDLQGRLAAQGTELLVVHLFLNFTDPGFRELQRDMNRSLRKICQEANLHCLATHDQFKDCPECFLKDDGHFTAEGHRRLAAFLDGVLAPEGQPRGTTAVSPSSAAPSPAAGPAGSVPPPPAAAFSSPPRSRSGIR